MSQQQPRQDSPARILEAADELLGETGYDGTSIRDVARRAGVNKALVFYYFSTKAELFERVLERYHRDCVATLAEAASGDGDEIERLHSITDAYLDFVTKNQRYARLIQQMVSGGDAEQTLVERNLTPFYDHVTGLLGSLSPAFGPRAARQLYITLSGAVLNYCTYAPALASRWGADPMSSPALEDRRAHVHWVIDTLAGELRPSS